MDGDLEWLKPCCMEYKSVKICENNCTHTYKADPLVKEKSVSLKKIKMKGQTSSWKPANNEVFHMTHRPAGSHAYYGMIIGLTTEF